MNDADRFYDEESRPGRHSGEPGRRHAPRPHGAPPPSAGRYGEYYGIDLGWRWRERDRDPGAWQRASRELDGQRGFDFRDEDWYDERSLEPMWQGDRQTRWEQPGFPPYGAYGPQTGKGPKGYQRSDERIREDVCDRLTQHGHVDATDITVSVSSGIVVLQGEIDDRRQKRMAEDVAESVPGVRDIRNELHVRGHAAWQSAPTQGRT